MNRGAFLLAAAFVLTQLLTACAGGRQPGGKSSSPDFTPGQLAKTDTDRVAEMHRRELFASLKLVTERLYKRNPKEWKKGGWTRAEEPVERLFGKQHNWRFAELDGKSGTDAIQLAFMPDYNDDRVFALSAGLGGMLLAAFNDRYEYFMTDDLDAQKLYNAARNVEVAVWKLSQTRAADGTLLLLSNETSGSPVKAANLGFEREFGKIIGNLDLLSNTIADKDNRTVVKVVQSVATAVFLPIAGVP